MDNPGFQPDFASGDARKDAAQADTKPPKEEQTVHMKRQIGLLGGVALIVSTIIGSGIFVSPARLIERTDSIMGSLVVWAVCGVLATLSALSYCELGTAVPRSGGEHAYFMSTFRPLHKFFGELPSFLFAWMTVFLLKPSSLAIISLAFGEYALYPLLENEPFCLEFRDSTEYGNAKKLLAVFISFLIAAVNIFSAKLATNVAIVFMVAKFLAIGLMISIGIYNVSKGDWGELSWTWDQGNQSSVGDYAASFYSGLWAYDGWNNLNFAVEELSNPYRNLPLAIIIGISLIITSYLLINIAYLTALGKAAMIDSNAVAISVGNKYLGVMKWTVPVLVCLSAAGTGNGSMFSAGRISYVAGRDSHIVDVMSYVHTTRLTPVVAILLNTLLSIPLVFASSINDLIDLFGFASWAIYGLATACVVILRFTQPDIKRPFKVPIIIPILATLMSAFLVVVPLVTDPKVEYLGVLGFNLVGVVVYYIFVYKHYRFPFMDQLTKVIQLATMAAPSPYKED